MKRAPHPFIPTKAGIQCLGGELGPRFPPSRWALRRTQTRRSSRSERRLGHGDERSVQTQLLNFTPVIASRLPCQIFSFSAFGRSIPSTIRSVSRVYCVPFSGSNGQSDANTILS